jgi:deoxyribonuclease-4
MSIAGGVWKSFSRGVEEGCVTMQIFTKNASRWRAPALAEDDARRFRGLQEETGIGPVVAHDSYLINLASPSDSLRARSRKAFLEEMRRAELLGLSGLVMHPGAHTGSGTSAGLKRLAESLDWIHEKTAGFKVSVCLENTAGQGTVLGGDFAHLGEIFARVREAGRLAVCLDTCHAFAAGYDLRGEEGYEKALASLESAVGPGRIRVVHTNDAKGELGSRLDRHEHLGRGRLGLECFRMIMNDPRLAEVPKILETPKEADGLPMDRVNLALLRALEGTDRVPPRLLEKVERNVRKAVGAGEDR